jgi:transposase-like protein
MRELAETSWSAVGRKYGVSDNAVRKWVRWYESEADAA